MIALLVLLARAPEVMAEPYPTKAVKVIVPFPPGATTDFMGRMFADYLRTTGSHPAIVENIAGASATIGMGAAAKSPPDGHTLLVTGASRTAAALLYKLSYDPIQDLVPVGIIGKIPTVFAIHKDVPAKTLREFVDLARANPGKYNFVSPGSGTPPHIASLEIADHFNLDIVHVPYRGMAPAITDLIAGRGHLVGVDVSPILQHIQNGTLRALAVAADKRIDVLPDVPTVSEAGLAGYEHYAWWGVFVPRGTSPDLVVEINRVVRAFVANEDARQKLRNYHVFPISLSTAEMKVMLDEELTKMSQIVKKHSIKAE